GERDPNGGAAMGTVIINALWILIYVFAYQLVRRHSKTPFQKVWRNWLLMALLGLPCVSAFWSVAPFLTLLHVAALCGTALFSVYLTSRFDVQEFLRLYL